MLKEIVLYEDDCVVIVDDDPSIHAAWKTRFENILKTFSSLVLKHYECGEKAIHFLNTLTHEQKNKIFLWVDYELLRKPINGLDIIKQSNVSRAALVTSHYADPVLCEEVMKTHAKLLPKQLAANVLIVAPFSHCDGAD